MNIHITPRTIYLTRHGESEHNLSGILGGDSDLSPRGLEYAKKLGQFVQHENIPGLHVWTSQVSPINYRVPQMQVYRQRVPLRYTFKA